MSFIVAASSEEPKRRYLSFDKLPNMMDAICPACKVLCRCQGTETTEEFIIQSRKCPQCGQNRRVYVRR